jgi:hypothetical protein
VTSRRYAHCISGGVLKTLAKRRQIAVTAILAAALLAGGSNAATPAISANAASARALDAYLNRAAPQRCGHGRSGRGGSVRQRLQVSPCPAAWKAITIEHLLTHTSGIPNYTAFADIETFGMTALTPAQLVGLFRTKPLDFPAGSRWSYIPACLTDHLPL